MKQKAIVIGAGLGGLSSAALLANSGYDVTVFEKNAGYGGKMQEVVLDGYRFDTGPSLLTMPFILEKLFEACGESLSSYISMAELQPLCRYIYPDGTIFDNEPDRQSTMKQIQKFAPEDTQAYADFLNYSEKLYNQTADAFLFNPLFDLSDLKGLKFSDFLGIDAFSTVSKKVDDYFQSGYLRKFFKRFTTYNGSSPFRAPATLNVIPHVELNQGGYYVEGGMYRIADAIHKLAAQQGVNFIFNSGVRSIQSSGSKVTGVLLEDGTTQDSDLVVANSDATDTILNLLKKDDISPLKRKRQASIEPSCSGFVLLLGVKKQWEELKHHNILFSDDYEKEFHQIFREKNLPDDPTIYVANTSYTNENHAPEGGSNLFILVNSPYVTDDQNWKEISNRYSSHLIDLLEKRLLDGLKSTIEVQNVISPMDFLTRYGSNKGSIYGTSSNSMFSAFLRPRNKLRGMDNLYLTGGSTHPGGGIPLVVQSAFNVMSLIKRSRDSEMK